MSPIENVVLVAGAWPASGAAAGADQTENRMIERKRWKSCAAAAGGVPAHGLRGYESAPAASDTRQFAPLDPSPDGRARQAEGAARLFDGEHVSRHDAQSYQVISIVSFISVCDSAGRPGRARM
jgi:hypothetical protein